MLLKMRYLPALLFALTAAPLAHAATSPSLGAAESYAILSGTAGTNVGATTITGDVGVAPGLTFSGGTITYVTPGNPHVPPSSNNAQLANTAAYLSLGTLNPDAECIGGILPDATDLTTLSPLGPGTYCSAGSFLLTGNLTLTGSGPWVFKAVSSLITSPGSSVTGGDACSIWWRVGSSATIETTTSFKGNILALTAITMKTGASISGRLFAQNAAVVLGTNTVSIPVCTAPAAPAAASATIPPLINVRKVPSPLALPAGPGSVTYNYTVSNPGTVTMTNITLTDDQCSNVTYVSGDANGNSWMETSEVWLYRCTTSLGRTTVNYATARGLANDMAAVDTAIAQVVVGVPVIPPLIHIVKTPSPLALLSGGGSVTYSYAVTNPGTVALTDVTVTDDKCASVSRVSGDTNGDSRLQPTETWHYTCTANVPITTTNTAVATGHANGLTAIDTALATVVVAGAPVPPLIHIIKKPAPVILPAGGGTVSYTYTVTNPGTISLDNVTVADDRCGPVNVVSGDANGNGLMETTETWTYSCQQNLSVSTVNTATATGHGNGFTVTDVAVASVVLSPALIPPVPTLPNTGVDPNGGLTGWVGAALALFAAAVFGLVLTQWKRLFR